MQSLLIGINAKYIHPAIAIYQLQKNTTMPCIVQEYTIKEQNIGIYRDIQKQIETHQVDLIGFSCYLWNIEKVLDIAFLVKQNFPKIHIMCGGPEVGFTARYYLEKYPFIDSIIQGEGEIAFHQLCLYIDHQLPIESVTNLCYIKHHIYTENVIQVPDLSKIELATLDVKDLENRIVYLESGRGCPYQCSYCTASLDNHVRFFPLDKVMSIVKELMKRKVKTVKFLDRTFNANMNYMIQLLDLIDQYNDCTTFQFEIVVEKLTPLAIERIRHLKQKFLRFEIGIQSAHDDVNLAVCRKQNIVQLEQKLKALQATHQVDLHVDLIAGLPYETKERFIESFNRVFFYGAKELQLGFLKFLKGTKLMNEIDEHEYIYDDRPPYEIIQNKYMSKADLNEIHLVEEMLDIYYNKGKMKKTFEYLIQHKKIKHPYYFFLNLSTSMHQKQLYEIFIHFDHYCKKYLLEDYNMIHFLLIQDYLQAHKTKPKRWWETTISKDNRKTIFTYLSKQTHVPLEDIYRYGVVYQNQATSSLFMIIYQNFKPISYCID
ncbi:MAG: B12-binding domain-containing radical SAM protein [Prevotella sp.]|nr:B12-binding domain-containing radical SAM protein [Staphylococcus sp.]MCM1350722.1 B12-binding domain-containing radical SAM protein [Prevotella sp.]